MADAKPNPVTALVSSRKFIVVVLALVACTVLTAIGKLATSQFVTTLTVLVGILTGAIAYEDRGRSPTNIATTGDVTVSGAPPPATTLPPPPQVPS